MEDHSGLCQHGADDKPSSCSKKLLLDFSTAGSVPTFTGIWDLESAGNQWTGDNAFYYSFKFYGRHVSHTPFDAGIFCKDKLSGVYQNDNFELVECEGDSLGGGWIKVFSYTDSVAKAGDSAMVIPNTPLWFGYEDTGEFNQYMWVDSGTKLDYAVNSGSWHSDGFDAEKHFFTADDGSFWKIRDRGQDNTWSFSNQCREISTYTMEGEMPLCQFGADNNVNNCASKVVLDFSKEHIAPNINGMWDVESAGNEWTGDNSFFYSFTLWAREKSTKVVEYSGSIKDFCATRETGTYRVNGQAIECHNDLFNSGGWIKLAEHTDD